MTRVNFTANYGNLVSDKEAVHDWDANAGITLPGTDSATYNAGLSPFFFARSGINGINIFMIGNRGEAGRIWSSSLDGTDRNWAYHFMAHTSAIDPSDRWSRAYALSLRCLVSTN